MMQHFKECVISATIIIFSANCIYFLMTGSAFELALKLAESVK